jgi:hypothetical protein
MARREQYYFIAMLEQPGAGDRVLALGQSGQEGDVERVVESFKLVGDTHLLPG